MPPDRRWRKRWASTSGKLTLTSLPTPGFGSSVLRRPARTRRQCPLGALCRTLFIQDNETTHIRRARAVLSEVPYRDMWRRGSRLHSDHVPNTGAVFASLDVQPLQRHRLWVRVRRDPFVQRHRHSAVFQSCVIVRVRLGASGSPSCVRSSAWHWLFSSQHNTRALVGGSR